MGFHPLVAHDHEFVAFWNAKCGCTSLKYFFLATVEGEDEAKRLCGDDEKPLHDYIGYENGPYAVTRNTLDRQLDGYFKFLVTRNPWARVSSFFLDKTANKINSWVDAEMTINSAGMSFRELINVMLDFPPDRLQHHLEPQSLGLEGIEFDDIVRLENAAIDFTRISQAIGVSTIQFPHLNRSVISSDVTDFGFAGNRKADDFVGKPHPDWRRLYDSELINAVSEIYRADFERFFSDYEPPPFD